MSRGTCLDAGSEPVRLYYPSRRHQPDCDPGRPDRDVRLARLEPDACFDLHLFALHHPDQRHRPDVSVRKAVAVAYPLGSLAGAALDRLHHAVWNRAVRRVAVDLRGYGAGLALS